MHVVELLYVKETSRGKLWVICRLNCLLLPLSSVRSDAEMCLLRV